METSKIDLGLASVAMRFILQTMRQLQPPAAAPSASPAAGQAQSVDPPGSVPKVSGGHQIDIIA